MRRHSLLNCEDARGGVIFLEGVLGPVVQSVVSLTSSLRIISLTVLADTIYNILIFFAENFFFQHICVSLDVNFNESLTNNVVSFEQLGPDVFWLCCTGRTNGSISF